MASLARDHEATLAAMREEHAAERQRSEAATLAALDERSSAAARELTRVTEELGRAHAQAVEEQSLLSASELARVRAELEASHAAEVRALRAAHDAELGAAHSELCARLGEAEARTRELEAQVAARDQAAAMLAKHTSEERAQLQGRLAEVEKGFIAEKVAKMERESTIALLTASLASASRAASSTLIPAAAHPSISVPVSNHHVDPDAGAAGNATGNDGAGLGMGISGPSGPSGGGASTSCFKRPLDLKIAGGAWSAPQHAAPAVTVGAKSAKATPSVTLPKKFVPYPPPATAASIKKAKTLRGSRSEMSLFEDDLFTFH